MDNNPVDILLIEDNITDAELAIRALKKNKITDSIVHLSDGVAALDFLFGKGEFQGRNINNMPKVIFLDLKMPRIDGTETLKKIKANNLTKKIPVIIFSSSKEISDIEKCYESGANSYIVKPVAFDAFNKVIVDLGAYWVLNNHTI